MSGNKGITSCVQAEQMKPKKRVLYHFAIFPIINKELIKKDRSICTSIQTCSKKKQSKNMRSLLAARLQLRELINFF